MAATREAAREAERLRGRLERKPAVVRQLAEARARVDDLTGRVSDPAGQGQGPGLRSRARWPRPGPTRDELAAEAERAGRQRPGGPAARPSGSGPGPKASASGWPTAEAQHAQLAELAADALHLGRVADLLNAFRTAVVATVGPRLAVQAAELFGELTDHEYDRLEVDPETYQLQIRDAGRLYGLERFSGSEVDLANLALRVAISEHVRFQSGGSVGLLVLDEVFGPLDEDRKARMLLALERLRGRFRQVLVVTHDSDIKEQLPNAIEVAQAPGPAGHRPAAQHLSAHVAADRARHWW